MSRSASGVGNPAAARVPVCAIGASAGGLTALRGFLEAVKPDLGIAFVVVVHLAPDHPSALAEILSKLTLMPVEVVSDEVRLRPNHVYVGPPDNAVVIAGDSVALRPFAEPRGRRSPIDQLFESLAERDGDAIAIVLSGEGSDGATGARAINESGGLVLAQDPDEAEHRAMPHATIATGHVDVVAPVAALAKHVSEIAHNRRTLAGLADERREDTLREIVATLRRRVGHDFAHYKKATLLRRIGRRMQVTRSGSLGDYAQFLRGSEEEAQALFADLLISVTGFFRDKSAFDALARDAIRPIFDRLETRETPEIRVWSVGCASGEEAYSLAMLLLEEAARRKVTVPIQVFATDIDEAALARGREGAYGKSIEAEVSEDRLKRFFKQEGETWRVRQQLRDTVLFARHSVLKDPPFMHLDLVTCRNLLIYLERDVQRQVLGVLRYALDTGGFLMLGSAETAEAAPESFRPLDREARIYVAEAGRARAVALPSGADSGPQAVVQPTRSAATERGPGPLHLAALEKAAPASVLVGEDLRVLHLSPTAQRFLAPSGGPLPVDLPALARPELRLDLKIALRRALDDGTPTLTTPMRVAFNGHPRRVAINVTPDPEADRSAPRALVFFLDGGPVPEEESEATEDAKTDEAGRLHEELRATQERLAASRNEHEIAMQELRAANEELQSVNEEYRSTSEELETSKEELQSMNEELQTLNAELKSKLETVSTAHNDLRNLVAATDYGTLFLDPQLKIRMFTPRVSEVINVTAADVDRPITDFSHKLVGAGVEADARAVLRDLAPIERDVATTDGRWLTVRLRPYRTLDERIDGVVVTFIDVTAARQASETIRTSEERFATLLAATTDVAYRMGPDWLEMRALRSGEFLADTEAPITDWLERYIPTDEQPRLRAAIRDAIARKGLFEFEHRVVRQDGRIGWTLSRAAPILAPDGSIREWFGVASDVTARREAEESLRQANDMLALATAAAQLGWATWDARSRIGTWDERGRAIMGLRPDLTEPGPWLAMVHPDDRERVEAEIEAGLAEGRAFDLEFRVRHPDGAVRHVQCSGVVVAGPDGAPRWGTGLIRDITARWQANETQRLLLEELNHRVKNMLTVILALAAQTREDAPSLEAFADAFEERVHALGQAHDALTRDGWKGASLEDLVRSAIGLFSSAEQDRVSVDGPLIKLGPSAATTFSLALHELCTNAIKHGALSNGGGRIAVSWRVGGEGPKRGLVFEWRETGGPAATTPARRGFGTRLLEEGLPGELDGTGALAFAADGVVYQLEAPLSEQIHAG